MSESAELKQTTEPTTELTTELTTEPTTEPTVVIELPLEDDDPCEFGLIPVEDLITNDQFSKLLISDIKKVAERKKLPKVEMLIPISVVRNRLSIGIKFLLASIKYEIIKYDPTKKNYTITPLIHSCFFSMINFLNNNYYANNRSSDIINFKIYKDILTQYILNEIKESKEQIDAKINIFMLSLEWLIKLFYLNKDFIKANLTINPIMHSLTEFKDKVFMNEIEKTLEILLNILLIGRRGETYNKTYLKQLINIFIIMGQDFSLIKSIKDITLNSSEINDFYIMRCEKYILIETANFYTNNHATLSSDIKENCYEFLKYIDTIINYEIIFI